MNDKGDHQHPIPYLPLASRFSHSLRQTFTIPPHQRAIQFILLNNKNFRNPFLEQIINLNNLSVIETDTTPRRTGPDRFGVFRAVDRKSCPPFGGTVQTLQRNPARPQWIIRVRALIRFSSYQDPSRSVLLSSLPPFLTRHRPLGVSYCSLPRPTRYVFT